MSAPRSTSSTRLSSGRSATPSPVSAAARSISRELEPGKAAVVAEVAEDGVISFEALMEAIGGAVARQ
jgi:hypothetical protein